MKEAAGQLAALLSGVSLVCSETSSGFLRTSWNMCPSTRLVADLGGRPPSGGPSVMPDGLRILELIFTPLCSLKCRAHTHRVSALARG